jgi:uncharacterized protein YpiB (UPF0302 family)
LTLSSDIITAIQAVREIRTLALINIDLLASSEASDEQQMLLKRIDDSLDLEERSIREVRRLFRALSASDAERYVWPRSLGGTP